MTQLVHKTPCAECPFRRASAPGWLGASHPDEFNSATVHGEEHMPCHMGIDYESKNWRRQLENAPHCAGSLIYLKNQCKYPSDAELRERMAQVEKDTATVFNWPHEFLKHHKREA